jgi:hypothetical protein
MCTWAELGLVGTMTFAGSTLSTDGAAAIAREFRSEIEH